MSQVLQGLPGATPSFIAFIQLVRGYTRDFPELNRLVAGEESTDRQIAWAILDAMSDFNGTPPITPNVTIDYLMMKSQHALLLRMVTCSLIESVGLLQTRNHINYSTGGTTVGVNDKTPMLMQWLQTFKASTEQMKQRVKVSLNIESIMNPGDTGIHSEYWATNSVYSSYLLG